MTTKSTFQEFTSLQDIQIPSKSAHKLESHLPKTDREGFVFDIIILNSLAAKQWAIVHNGTRLNCVAV